MTQQAATIDTHVGTDLDIDASTILDVPLSDTERLSVGGDSRPRGWAGRAARIAGSSVVTGGLTVLAGGFLAVAVGAGVANVGDGAATTGVRPTVVLPPALQPASEGDARHGLTADAATRRSGGVVIDGPSTGDARRGLTPDSVTLRGPGTGRPLMTEADAHARDADSRRSANVREDRSACVGIGCSGAR